MNYGTLKIACKLTERLSVVSGDRYVISYFMNFLTTKIGVVFPKKMKFYSYKKMCYYIPVFNVENSVIVYFVA